MRHGFGRLAACAVAAAAVGLAAGGRPDDPEKSKAPAKPAAPAGPKSTVLVLKTDPDINLNDLEENVKTAITKSGGKCTNLADLKPEPMSPSDYDAVQRFVKGIRTRPAAGAASRVQVYIKEKPVLLLTADGPGDFLDALEVKYQSGNTASYKVKPAGDADAKLTKFTATEYQLVLPEADYPKSYKATFRDKDKKEKRLEGDLGGARHFSITLDGFEGDIGKLCATFKDESIFAVPANVDPTDQQTIVMANFSSLEPDDPGVLVSQDEIVLRAEQGRKLNVKRVWVLFPLSPAAAAAALKSFAAEGSNSMPQKIRAAGPVFQNAADPPFAVDATTKPTWLELAAGGKGGGFERRIAVKDAAGLRAKLAEASYLVVWEFQPDGEKPQALQQFLMVGKERTKPYVVARTVDRWADLSKPAPAKPADPAKDK